MLDMRMDHTTLSIDELTTLDELKKLINSQIRLSE
ncbi:MAG: hypothetical protein CM15mL5_1010 [uncultured marine virus]|nr:MAG: hypothetical protein CM15mL5_1010 [uncultured marine virus]